MKFDNSLIGHDLPQKILFHAIRTDKLGHAYLFCGEENIGKRAVAFAVAKSLLCQNSIPFCGTCPACLKADHRTHPDLFEVFPDGPSIKISQIKQIQAQLILKPAIGAKKVFIIDGVDQMNLESANCFLKSLEEPPVDTHFFLITSRPRMIPSTLLSRCQLIRFSPPLFHELVSFLTLRKNFSEEEAFRVATRSQGKVGNALLLDLETLDQEDEKYLNLICPETLASPSRLFHLTEELSRDADYLGKTLEWISCFLRDMMVWQLCRQPDHLILRHHLDKINQWADTFSPENLYQSFIFVQKIEKLLTRNLNRSLVLETVLFQLRSHPGAIP
ncbi:MAG: DNA polymerase III subunit [Nitrospiria bacterium]